MEIIVLDSSNWKVILTADEVERMRLRPSADFEIPQGAGREAALRLLRSAEGGCRGEIASLRLYPRVDGGAELYATAATATAPVETPPDRLCRMEAVDDALALRAVLLRSGSGGTSEIYLPIGQTEGCFMRILGAHPPILSEFGQILSISGADALPWLKEHCRPLPSCGGSGAD